MFSKKTNSAEELLKNIYGKTQSGFHVALVDPNGNTLKVWSDDKINPDAIAGNYLAYMEYMQGIRNIPGCPAVTP